jgi:hypothetical protein
MSGRRASKTSHLVALFATVVLTVSVNMADMWDAL